MIPAMQWRGRGYSGGTPGSIRTWGYNNYGFAVLGLTLERASGEYLDGLLERRFLQIMDIDAAFESGELRDTERLAVLYRADGSVGRSLATARNQKRPGSPGSNGRFFAGGFTSSAGEFAKLVALLANDGRYQEVQLLSEGAVATMETSQGNPGGFQQCLPLRYQNEMYGRGGLYYHTGSAYSVYNFCSYDPDTGDGVVVLTTGASAVQDEWGVYAVCGDISKAVYRAIQ